MTLWEKPTEKAARLLLLESISGASKACINQKQVKETTVSNSLLNPVSLEAMELYGTKPRYTHIKATNPLNDYKVGT